MRTGRSGPELARLREEFRARADEAFSQMFGSDGQNGLVTFTEWEDRACEATDALARWLLEEHLALDGAADPGVQVDCPICGAPVRYDSPGEDSGTGVDATEARHIMAQRVAVVDLRRSHCGNRR